MPAPPDPAAVVAVVRAYLKVACPGLVVDTLQATFCNSPRTFCLPLLPIDSPSDSHQQQAGDPERQRTIPYSQEVLTVLRDTGRSMTRAEILAAMSSVEVSDRTLARWLPRMVEAGLLISSRVDGYSLPEWQ